MSDENKSIVVGDVAVGGNPICVKKTGLGITFGKLVRHCPRCRAHRYHSSVRNPQTNRISITCAECGHRWKGRFLQDEWSDGDHPSATADVLPPIDADHPLRLGKTNG